MTEIKVKYHEMWNFIAAYFGDYKNGKSDVEIIQEAKQQEGNSRQYLLKISTEIRGFLSDKSYSTEEKCGLIRDTNVYFKTDEEILNWLRNIGKLLSEL